MSAWGSYESRLAVRGKTRRDHALKNAQRYINRKSASSLSYKTVEINGNPQNVFILDKADIDIKEIHSMPGETLIHGGIVFWADAVWLITEMDYHNEVYQSAIMQQCNHKLRWIDDNGEIIEKWSIVVDGTKYLIGEKTKDIMSIGDARIAVTVARDNDTVKLSRGRRFLIDDPDCLEPQAYQITKPNKLYKVYNNAGVLRFIMNEVQLEDADNKELLIANYYDWKPRYTKVPSDIINSTFDEVQEKALHPKTPEERGNWL